MQPSTLPTEFRTQPFTVASARTAGVSPSRLRRSDLARPFHGVRAHPRSSDGELTARCRALCPLLPDHAMFSHSTAAALHGLPVPTRTLDRLHVSAPRPARAMRRTGVVGHQLDVVRPVRHDDLPVAEPVESWVELASMLEVDDLVIVGDALLRRVRPVSDLSALQEAVDAASGRPGIRRLRQALPLVRPRTDSPMETVLRLAIVRAGLPEPNVNHVIHAAERSHHADLAYPTARIAIEYDGEQHRTDDRQYRVDIDRLSSIQDAGWRVVRVNRVHLANGADEAIARIRAALPSTRHNTPLTTRW